MRKSLLFIHIPKTAGSAINAALSSVSPFARHIESDPLARDRLTRGEPLPPFVSGHIPASTALSVPNRSDFVIFTFLRDPIRHVISHLKWCKSLGHPDRRQMIETHPDSTKEVCQYLHDTDLNDVDRLSRMMEAMPQARRFFDNCQTRYLSSQPATFLAPKHLDTAMENVDKMDYIGLSEDLSEDLTKVLAIAGWEDRPEVPVTNVAPLAEMPDMSSSAVSEFYRSLTIYDRAIYASCAMRRIFTDPFNPAHGGAVAMNNDQPAN